MRCHFSLPLRTIAGVLILACNTERPRDETVDTRGTQTEDIASKGCGNPAQLEGGGIGALRIGRSAADVASDCEILSDTTVRGAEGMPARMLSVRLDQDTVRAEVVDGKIWRIEVITPSFRTIDSLGVGTPLSRLLEEQQVRGLSGEGRVFAAVNGHCGLSFELSETQPWPSGDWTRAALERLPKHTSVKRVLVVGCQ